MLRALFAILLMTPSLSWAVALYSGEISVEGQSDSERQSAIPAALIQVLQKHSGQRELPINPALDAALDGAARMMLSFRYRNHEKATPEGVRESELRLVVDFLPAAIDRVVNELGLPRWREDRRPLTIWIVVDDGMGRRLTPLEYAYAWDALKDVASLRGLPITWPDIDPERDGLIDLQLLWGGFTDALPGHDLRQGGDVIVAARREGPMWNVRWNFGVGDETSGWRIKDHDLTSALVDGLHRLTDLVASRDSIAPDAQGDWQSRLVVTQVGGPGDYARCLAYLESLAVVEAVGVSEVFQDQVTFILELNALPEYLVSELERGRVIASVPEQDRYRLLRP